MAAPTSSTSRLFSSCTCAVRRSALRIQRSQIHTRPRLPYDIENGVQPFLSAKAVKGTAVDWQQGNLSKLNDLIRGTPHENKSVAQTVIDAAKSPSDVLIFGHASEALNNGYFLSCLTPSQTPEKSLAQNGPMQDALSNNFGSPTSFISHFSSYAMGMFGTGYVWLVMDSVDNLAVVGTYGAGTVLVQGTVLPQKARELDALAGVESPSTAQSASRGEGASSRQNRSYHSSAIIRAVSDFPGRASNSTFDSTNYARGEIGTSPTASAAEGRSNQERFKSIHPLLCLSLHPHVYIPDYGVWGKEEYIRNFWGNVDWNLVYQRYQKVQDLRKLR